MYKIVLFFLSMKKVGIGVGVLIVLVAMGYFIFYKSAGTSVQTGVTDQPPIGNVASPVVTEAPPAIAPTPAPAAVNPPPVVKPVPTPAPAQQPGTYTMTQVATHASASSCWSVINGGVYDLTSWIGQHPGGSKAILGICGKDGSSAFNDQHGGQRRPANELTGFKIGALAK